MTPAYNAKGECVECGISKAYGHSRTCRWDHSCIRDDGGTGFRRCYACELENQ